MLRTAGFSPVAQEFSCASRDGSFGSDTVPVAPECPRTAIESSASVVTGVGEALSATAVVEADDGDGTWPAVLSPPQPASATARRAAQARPRGARVMPSSCARPTGPASVAPIVGQDLAPPRAPSAAMSRYATTRLSSEVAFSTSTGGAGGFSASS